VGKREELLTRLKKLLGESTVAYFSSRSGTKKKSFITSTPVEASMRPWQPRLLAHLLDAKPLGPVGTHQLREATDRNAAGSADELQQPAALFVIHGPDKLKGNV
jgi:hypothetical protein